MNASPSRGVCSAAVLLLTLGALGVAGCASKAERPAGDLVLEAPRTAGVTTKEYKYVTRLGSHIPVRVPKDGVTTPAPGASPVQYFSGEILRDIVNRPGSGRR